MEDDFVKDPKIWYDSDRNFINHPYQQIGAYSGIYSYYSDVENNCFYLHISYSEDSISSPSNNVYVNFNIENSSREYQFFVDKSGFFYADSGVKSAFNVAANFGTPSEQGQEIYIGIEFCNKDDKKCNNELSFSLIVNGQSYALCRGINLNYQQEESTKETKHNEGNGTGKSTSKGAGETADKTAGKTASSTTQAQTKFKYTGGLSTTGAQSNLRDADNGEKFVYNGKTEYNHSDEYDDADYDYDDYDAAEMPNNDAEVIVKPKNESGFAEPSKMMLAAAGLCVVTGAALAACGIVNRKRNKGNGSKDE